MTQPQPLPSPLHRHAALIVLAAGVCAALHVGKLAPAIPALRDALGLGLVQAGFLLSLVQAAGMLLGVAVGAWADGLGARRSMLLGLAVLALASAAGGTATGAPALLALRALEGFGFLLVVLPAPGLVRALVAPQQVNRMMGLWGAYMPLATALALLLGPLCIAALGWRAWWWLLAALSALMAWVLARALPVAQPAARSVARPRGTPATAGRGVEAASGPVGIAWSQRLRLTLAAPGPWLVALSFAMYSGQWLAVIGFLPVIATQAGAPLAAIGPLTALVAAANMVGNIASGRLLQRGVPAQHLLATGFLVMALGAAATFTGAGGNALPPALRFVAVLLFSGLGGLIPGTLFSLAVRVAPGAHTLSTTVGWVQQWSSLGQFAGPPLVAWVASRAGGWQYTGWVTGTCSLAGLALLPFLMRQLAR